MKSHLDFRGEKLKIWKWVFHLRFSLMKAFWIYLRIWKWLSRNQDITVWRILVDLETRVKCHNWSNSIYKYIFFLMSSSCIIESIASYKFKFRWVKFILLDFEASPPVSEREDKESQEDISKILSAWNNLKYSTYILKC